MTIKEIMPIFTGDISKKNTNKKNGLPRETAVLGSIRWWYEALIRGLNGTACDLSSSKCNQKKHCVACELFGCTGWSRKFRLIIDRNEKAELIFRFIELRAMEDEEWSLLNMTLNIIADYGIIGGKMSNINDYGLIEIKENDLKRYIYNKDKVKEYILNKKGKYNNNYFNSLPDFKKFIFVEKNDCRKVNIKNFKSDFLKEEEAGKSKRYFFKKNKENGSMRFFAYAEKEKYKQLKRYFKEKGIGFLDYEKVLKELII